MAEIKIKADNNGGTVSLKGPASTTNNAAVQLTLPVDDGTTGQYLKTDGSGVLSWATVDTAPEGNVVKSTTNGNEAATKYLRADGSGGASWQSVPAATTTSGTDNFTIADGNLVIGTAGHGIDFSATADGTGSSQNELFSDYEYGKWTPTCKSQGTVNAVTAEYIRVGHFVWIHGYVNTISDQTSSDIFRIEGLPFTVESLYGSGWESKGGSGACLAMQCGASPEITTSYSGSGDDISFSGSNSGSWHQIKHSHFNHVNAMVTFTATYTTS